MTDRTHPKPATETAVSRAARKERRRERSRDEIVAAARAVLLRSGIGAMTLEAVATEAGMSKTGLYYYFASKDALVFELVYGTLERQAVAVRDAVAVAADGGAALAAIIRETVAGYGAQIDDFRLAFLFGQVAGAGAMAWSPEQFARIRPLNGMILGEAAALLREPVPGGKRAAGVDPRLLAFLAYLSALGLLTMKGLVEQMGDPLLYSDAQLVEGLARVFTAAAAPVGDA